MVSQPRTLAVVLTWNSERYIEDCLHSLAGQDDVVTVVVDNSSTDGTIARARGAGPGIRVIENGDNLGYAGGNNVGLGAAITEGYQYGLLVNPDVELRPGCVDALVRALESDPKAAFASPVISDLDGDVWYAGSRIDRKTATTWHDITVDGDQAQRTDRPTGAVLLVDLSLVAPVGLLDERFFLYFEETEWATRLARRGYHSLVVPGAAATHDVGHGQRGRSATYQYYMTRNHLLFASESGRPLGWVLLASLRASAIAIWFALLDSPAAARVCVQATLKGYWDYARGRFGRQRTTWTSPAR